MVLQGKPQTAVWWIMDRGKVGVTSNACSTLGKPVMDVLWSKHQYSCAPLSISLDTYPVQPPELVPVDPTYEIFMEVAWRLSGGAVPRGTDSISFQYWLLCFG